MHRKAKNSIMKNEKAQLKNDCCRPSVEKSLSKRGNTSCSARNGKNAKRINQ
jgi:hypothetical protein